MNFITSMSTDFQRGKKAGVRKILKEKKGDGNINKFRANILCVQWFDKFFASCKNCVENIKFSTSKNQIMNEWVVSSSHANKFPRAILWVLHYVNVNIYISRKGYTQNLKKKKKSIRYYFIHINMHIIIYSNLLRLKIYPFEIYPAEKYALL